MEIDNNAIRSFGEDLKSKGKLPATVESYSRDAKRFLNYLTTMKLAPAKVEPDTLVAYQHFLQETQHEKENSIRRTIIGVRQFYRFLTEKHHLSETPFDVVPIPERKEILPSDLDISDLENVIDIARKNTNSFIGARNGAILALLAFEGLKATEVIDLHWSDYLPGSDEGNTTLKVRGTRARLIILEQTTYDLLQIYREHYDNFQKLPAMQNVAQSEKRMFMAFRGREASIPIPRMTRHGLKFILYELGEKIGVKHLNTEMLRHFAVNHLLARGKTAEEVMGHLGLRRLGNISKHLSGNPSALVSSSGKPINP
jgi:integrase/recombinase XerD